MPHANHGTRATVNDNCVSKAQIVAQVKATDQCPEESYEKNAGKVAIILYKYNNIFGR